MQIAREPVRSRSAAASKTSTASPCCASRPASVRPTAPAPMTATSVLEGVPDLAVALRGPDARVVDAVQLIPGALHVEGHGVLEDREAGVASGELRVDLLEGLLERASGILRLARTVERRAEEVARVVDGRADLLTAHHRA